MSLGSLEESINHREKPTAGTQEDGEDWQERQEVAGCLELGEPTWECQWAVTRDTQGIAAGRGEAWGKRVLNCITKS